MYDVLVDAFGGDNAPAEVVKGTIEAIKEREGFRVVLVGKEEEIRKHLENYSFDGERITVLDAKDVITCDEEPAMAVMKKPESSICVAFKRLREDENAKAFVSAGSTGAVLAGATLKLGRIHGINRPALCPILPSAKEGKTVFFLDSGANADCKDINLIQFAVMGSCYAEIYGVKNPKVALLSNGTEDEKGNALNHEVFPRLKKLKGINFCGNIEARDILSGEYDVVVTDGFSGNVALKSMEGTVGVIFGAIKEEVMKTFRGKIGAMLLKKSFKAVKSRLDYNEKGGALFLGVKKPVIKAHGSSKSKSIKNAVLQACDLSEKNITEALTLKLAENENAEV